ncbi:MAG: MutS-related protein [Pseudobacter sp.]|uniref:MutS-related protein n=1 Tax=Pseudobacter sp. TaxID=2045420 RepID=UPI003F7E025B
MQSQEILQQILAHLDLWDLGINNADIYYIEHYFKSEIVILDKNKSIARLKLLVNKSPYKHQMMTGVKQLAVFLSSVMQKLEQAFPYCPDNLKPTIKEIHSLVNESEARKLAEWGIAVNELSDYELLQLDHEIRFSFKESFYKALGILYKIEALFSLAKAIKVHKLVFPQFSTNNEFEVKDCWNPALENCTRNSFYFENNKNIILLTGPNMSGKSTFLRTVGLIACLAHTGMAIPAVSATLPFFDSVEICISIQDSLTEGYSHFYAELKKVKTMAEQLKNGHHCFMIFDELFKGTNLSDAARCTAVLANGILQHPDSYCIFSSHHTGLMAADPALQNQLQFSHVETLIEDGVPRFTYIFKPGISNIFLGYYFLQKEGIDKLMNVSGH